jgi:hypothetical protein
MENPFQFSGPGDAALPAPDQPPTPPPTTVRRPPARRQSWVLPILVPYAAFMTVMALVYYFKYSDALRNHPLENIPDLLGDFQQKQSKGSQTRSLRLPAPDQDLPERLTTTLGRPIRVGDIEVEPLSIEYGPWSAYTKVRNRPEPKATPIKDTLVLHVRLTNLSRDLTYYPTDPYFDRRPKDEYDRPYVLIDVGGKKFFGGLIEYEPDRGNVERSWLKGQDNDDKPLGPRQSRETVLVSRPKDAVLDSVKKTKSPAVWRVQVRRGLVPYHDIEVPVAAVVGVSFTAADVKKAG